jgi:hypothetical protein
LANRLPADQWYTGDWFKDVHARSITLAAKGFWRDVLDYMHAEDTYKLTKTWEQFGRICGCTPAEAEAATRELLDARVCDVRVYASGRACIVSRRRKREHDGRKSSRDRKKRSRAVTPMSQPSHRPSSSSSSCTPLPPHGGDESLRSQHEELRKRITAGEVRSAVRKSDGFTFDGVSVVDGTIHINSTQATSAKPKPVARAKIGDYEWH